MGNIAKWQNALARGRQLCTQLSLLKEVSQNCFVLILPASKIEEVSQNCFVFDVTQVNIEEVSQHYRVFDVVKFKS